MGKEQPSSYYDKIYESSKEYNKEFSKSRYINLWSAMEKHLIKDKNVVDVGCGVGQTAGFLINKGYGYVGIDFSNEAIKKAFLNNSQSLSNNEKFFSFICEDIFNVDYSLFKKSAQLFICETLEHINNDIELISKIKNDLPNTNIVISIPSFNDVSHVRYFSSVDEVIERYKSVIKIVDCYKLGSWFVLHGEL